MIILRYDFQGWPMQALTLREFLTQLGFKEKDGNFSIPNEAVILDAYPRLLEDDGMAYGINEQYIIVGDKDVYEDKIGEHDVKVFNIFREPGPRENEDEEENNEKNDKVKMAKSEYKAGTFLYGIPSNEEVAKYNPEGQRVFIHDGCVTGDGYGKAIGYEDGVLKRSTGYGNFQWGGDVRLATEEEIREFFSKLYASSKPINNR